MPKSKSELFYTDSAAPELSSMRGVGRCRSLLLEKLGLKTVADVFTFFPYRYENRGSVRKISEVIQGKYALVSGQITALEKKFANGKVIWRALLNDGSGSIRAVWFNRRGFDKIIKCGMVVALYGNVSTSFGENVMTEPEYEIIKEGGKITAGIIPVYPLTGGMSAKWLRNFTEKVIDEYAQYITETLPPELIAAHSLMARKEAIIELHKPSCETRLSAARERMAYEELYFMFLRMAQLHRRDAQAFCYAYSHIAERVIASLPFALTDSQRSAFGEIMSGAKAPFPVTRLLEGDVGCGKTLVAILFAAAVCGSGGQCALLAPTEILAEQLYAQAVKYLEPHGIKCVLIKSSMPAKAKRDAVCGIADGSVQLAAGTQALLSDKIDFANLGAVIIDEQQRFGVRQREALIEANPQAHVLMMSATPIPRTMAMALYGDIACTVIRGKPPCRTPVITRIITKSQVAKLLDFMTLEIMVGCRCYWICPRVEEHPSIGRASIGRPPVGHGAALAAAEKRFEWLRKKLTPIGISLVHGQMSGEDKERAINSFRSGGSPILVGTTVLEVGVDVPEASVIVIENPERYGLSQLHQLRGRVGRGERRGVCVLISDTNPIPERLKIFSSTNDGFEIARMDLRLRGEGEIAGTAQHGDLPLKIADPLRDGALFEKARRDAMRIK